MPGGPFWPQSPYFKDGKQMSKRDCDRSKVTASVCQGQAAPRSLLLNAFPNPFFWPWHCLVAGPAGQPELLLSSGGSFAVSTLQQPLRRHLEARKCWLMQWLAGSADLGHSPAQPSPFPCTVVSREKHKERRKPHLAAASSRNHPSPVKNPLLIRITES